MKKRVSYPISVKEEAVRMKLIGIPTKEIMDKLGIKNSTQVKVLSHMNIVSRLVDETDGVHHCQMFELARLTFYR
ncbi:hypothetical protein WAX46_03470 [Bacillus sp. FJAT-53060]|uniref:hypothetical protein n=1 Tax=Bacillus sp. FJAT-53060 TaxID=3127666 RepID=UPI0030136B2C